MLGALLAEFRLSILIWRWLAASFVVSGINRSRAGPERRGADMAQFRRWPERALEMFDRALAFEAGLNDFAAALFGFQRKEELSIVELPHT